MPVATAAKVEALSVDFRSQAALAEILGVSRSRVTRWLKGGDRPAQRREGRPARARLVEPASCLRAGGGPLLALGRQPAARRPAADRPRPGGAGRGADAGDPRRARGLVRLILHRCFAWNERARAGQPDSPLWFPRDYQGDGRHDNPDVYGCLYLTDREVSGVVEQLARFRGQRLIEPMLIRRRLQLALAALELPDDSELVDLDDPAEPGAAVSARAGSRRATGDHAAAGARRLPRHRRCRDPLVVDPRVVVGELHALRPQRPGAVGRRDQAAGARRSGGRRSCGVPRTSARCDMKAPSAASSCSQIRESTSIFEAPARSTEPRRAYHRGGRRRTAATVRGRAWGGRLRDPRRPVSAEIRGARG